MKSRHNITRIVLSASEKKHYRFHPLYNALKIGLFSTAVGLSPAYAIDLPSVGSGCEDSTTSCEIDGSMGNDFNITNDIISDSGSAINIDKNVTDSTITIDQGVTVQSKDDSGYAVYMYGGSGNTITNNGSIYGPINFDGADDLTLVNNGSIVSINGLHGGVDSAYDTISNFGKNFTLINNEGASITTPTAAIQSDFEFLTPVGSTTIYNAGTINSVTGQAIALSGDNNTISLATTSVIHGDVSLLEGYTNNVLNLLAGNQGVGTFGNYVYDSSFNYLNIDAAGEEWDLTGRLIVADAIHVYAGEAVVTGELGNTGTGSTTIDAGAALQVGDGGTTGTLTDNVINNGALAFDRSDSASFDNAISGTGDLFKMGSGTLTLNKASSYTGATIVSDGVLSLGADAALGATSDINLQQTGQLDLNGKVQTAGSLNMEAGTLLDFNGGDLTLTSNLREADDNNDSVVLGHLKGSGNLTLDSTNLIIDGANADLTASTLVTGGSSLRLNNAQGLGNGKLTLDGTDEQLTFDTFNGQTANGDFANSLAGNGVVQLNSGTAINLTADNTEFNGEFTISDGAQLTVSTAENLGAGTITDSGTFQVNNSTNWALNNSVSGSGDFVKSGSGQLTVYQMDYLGSTLVQNGTLVVGNSSQAGAQLGAEGAGPVTVGAGATLSGTGVIIGDVTNDGTIAALNALPESDSVAASILVLNGDLNNNGMVQLAGSGAGNTLSVAGNYTGGGSLALQTELGGDDSVTDKLVIDGNSSGVTSVTVTNAGGQGGQTINGIEVIDVGGESDGTFTLKGRAVAGAYEYQLVQNSENGDWYLQSQDTSSPVNPTNPDDPVNPVDPVDPVQPSGPNYRPETGAYLANQEAAQAMFQQTLYDRSGAARDQKNGDSDAAWVRLSENYSHQKGTGSLFDERTHTTVVQLGSDLYQHSASNGSQFVSGVMAGYGHSSSDTSVATNSHQASSHVNGYSLGAYGTWYQNADSVTGSYVDSWMQHAWYKNYVDGDDLPEESYNSQGTTASIETGYGFTVAQSEKSRWLVIPQAQLVYNNYKTSDHTDQTGTKFGGNHDDGISSRMGVRLAYQNMQQLNSIQPYVEVNWYHGQPAADSVDVNQDRFENDTTKNRYEAKVGVNGSITKNLQSWGQISGTTGDNDYRSYAAMVGVKYKW